MTTVEEWLVLRPQGLYCIPGDFYIDPIDKVDAAIITHGHRDHAIAGHKKVLATPETIAIMQLRYGLDSTQFWQKLAFGTRVTINQIKVLLLPAGHVLGSAQIVLEYKHKRVIISGDYKRRGDPTCAAFEVMPCDIFITEATFGLPIFRHPAIQEEIGKLLQSLKKLSLCHLVGVYPLGKCQRLIKALREANYHEPIYLHGALFKLCHFYESLNIHLGDLRQANTLNEKNAVGKIVLCPPSSLHDRWTRRFGEIVRANASGWMQIRARAKQKGIDLPLIISDHADWLELLQTIDEVRPGEIWVTHGQEEALVYSLLKKGYKAQALHLLGYEDSEE
ncbi:ligase-associated DNA damage response exonuclease [Legionella cardiaca]|uniref:Ligase-associated DNA damage response exonuclease n=1 Tax=Legionella cardiaca TaxID=1071983 RepID=A0ABY8AR87_9GAMM|nr:ligase-associated DNA damage response exonuclease [Legionella cardiaca]WED42040.1 ligase-associated DNA damage response exonuclease [Legionella cardiaca]